VSPTALLVVLTAVWLVKSAGAPYLKAAILDLMAPTNVASDDSWVRTASHFAATTERSDKILVWGAEPQVYLLSRRDAPTCFFYQYPLISRGYANEDLAAEFLSDLRRDPPRMIVDALDLRLPPIDSRARARWQSAYPFYASIPNGLDEFFAFVEREYRRGPDINAWSTYERLGTLDADGASPQGNAWRRPQGTH
jgi:hypothetical protein